VRFLDGDEFAPLPRKLVEWRRSLEGINPDTITANSLQQLRFAVGWLVEHERQPAEELSTAALNAFAEFSLWLRPAVRLIADSLGKSDSEQNAMFSLNYEARSNAWEALRVRLRNRTASAPAASPEKPADTQPGSALPASSGSPAALQGDSGAAGGSSDQTEVDAEALAVHSGCSSKRIRDILGTCEPSRKDDRGGRLWWRYGSIVATLRQWCAKTRTHELRLVQWPENAAELRQRKKPQPERSKK